MPDCLQRLPITVLQSAGADEESFALEGAGLHARAVVDKMGQFVSTAWTLRLPALSWGGLCNEFLNLVIEQPSSSASEDELYIRGAPMLKIADAP